MINLYTIKINKELDKDVFNDLMKGVSEEKRLRIQKFKFYADAQRSLFGELLVRYGIKQRFNLNYKTSFDINEYGKPYITEYPNIHFNVSHSGNWVICAISNSIIGIDVEEMKQVDLNIAKRFFAKEEYQALLKTEYNKQQEFFFKIWTLKESYIKAIGKGLSIPLDSFIISVNKNNIVFKSKIDFNEYSFAQFLIDKNHVVALCSESNVNYKMHLLSYQQLL